MTEGSRSPGRDANGRFVSGSSGNRKGRPRKPQEQPASAFDVIVDRELTIHRNGVPQQVSIEEALQHKTLQDALEGKRLAERQVLKWILEREAWVAKNTLSHKKKPVEVRYSPNPDNAKHALQLLGIVARDTRFDEQDSYYPRQLLEPWAVNAALKRRRGWGALSEREIADVERLTRNPEKIIWPRRSRE